MKRNVTLFTDEKLQDVLIVVIGLAILIAAAIIAAAHFE